MRRDAIDVAARMPGQWREESRANKPPLSARSPRAASHQGAAHKCAACPAWLQAALGEHGKARRKRRSGAARRASGPVCGVIGNTSKAGTLELIVADAPGEFREGRLDEDDAIDGAVWTTVRSFEKSSALITGAVPSP
jgi:hypothetical protein